MALTDTWFSSGLAVLSQKLDFDDLEGLLQPKFFYDVTRLTVLDTTNI